MATQDYTVEGDEITPRPRTLTWRDHRAYLSSGIDTVNVAGMHDGNDYIPITKIVATVDEFLNGVTKVNPGIQWVSWYTKNSSVEHKLGYLQFAELLGIEYDPEKFAESSREAQRIAESLNGHEESIAIPGLSEAGLSVWGKTS